MPRLKKEEEKRLKQSVIDTVLNRNRSMDQKEFKIEELVRQTGLSKQFIYHHFSGKEGVLLATAEQLYEKIFWAIACGGDRLISDPSDAEYLRDKEVLILVNRAGSLFYEHTVSQLLRSRMHAGEMEGLLHQLYQERLSRFKIESVRYSARQLAYFHRYVVLGAGLCISHDGEFPHDSVEQLAKSYRKLEAAYWKELVNESEEQTGIRPNKSELKKMTEQFQIRRKDNKIRQSIRSAVRILGKEQSAETITVEQISRKTGLNVNTIYMEYASKGDIMDDMAVSIWTSVLQHTARIWIKKNSLKKKIGEQFKATVRILQMWGGGLSSQILTNDSNFCRNTKYLCRNLGHLAGVSHIDESKMNLPEIRMLAYAAWSIWIGCCITVAGDRNFHRSRLECYGQFAAALGLACVHILQHEVTRIQTSAQPKGILKLENGEK